MPTPNLKKDLKMLTNEELIKHIIELDKKFKPVQEYYQLFLTNDVSAVVEKYKKIIESEFYPARGLPKIRLSVARKAVTDAKKAGLPTEALADLMLFYVETGVQFTRDFGDIDEAFYISIESMYLKGLELIEKEGFLPEFQPRVESILQKAENTGWGFYDTLGDYYWQFYH